MAQYKNPVKVIQTGEWRDTLLETITKANISNPIIVTSTGNKFRLKLELLFKQSSIFCLGSSNPNFQDCKKAATEHKMFSDPGIGFVCLEDAVKADD